MNNKERYQIKTEKDCLFFKTSYFKVEQKSVLHKDIYSKEFSSMLSASLICILAYMTINYLTNAHVFFYLPVLILVFISAFLVSQRLLSREKYLEAVFNRGLNTVSITRPGIFKKKIEEIPLENIKAVVVGNKIFIPENPDGIKFVEKISLQHGSFIPGLGEEEEFVTLSLQLADGSERIIYAGSIDDEPYLPLKDIEQFLRGK